MGKGSFGGKGSKYKKVILAVFPNDPAGEIQIHNVGKLVHFCELTPQKLPKVALFLEKRVDADLAKSKLGYVEVSMKIFNELIKGCRKHLPLFVASILKLIRLLLEKNEYPELKIIATETFIRFAEVHDETAQYSELEVFVGYFIAMCNNNINNDHMRRRLRIQGLRGLRAYIGILDVVDELDSFVSRQSSSKSLFFPTILDNMQYTEPSSSEAATINLPSEEEQRTSPNVKGLSTEVLRDLASRVNNITVTSLSSAVLSYLDTQDKWIPNTFAIECLRTISYSLNNQHNQIMMTKVLQHLESPHSIRVTQQIVSTIVSIASESTGPVVIVLSSLMKLLVSTIQEAAQTPPAADVEEKLKLQEILIGCVGAVSKKFPSPAQKVEAMGFILSLYEEHAARAVAGGFTLALVLAECVLAVGAHLGYLPSDCVPVHLFSTLLKLAGHSDPTVRVYAQRIIHCLLLPGRSLGQMVSISPSDVITLTGSGCDDLILRHGSTLRDSLLNTAIMHTNQPENYAVILHTLTILLYRARDKELQYSIPLVLKMQRKFQKKKGAPPLQARSLHTLVAAYLLLVARLYECQPLEAYVKEVLESRQEQGQVCRYLELKSEGLVCLLVKTMKYSESAKHRSVSVFFDKTKVTNFLAEIPALQQEYGVEHLQSTLSVTYRTRGKLKSEDTVASASTLYAPSIPASRGLPPLTPRISDTRRDESEAASTFTKEDKKPQPPADTWPFTITPIEDPKVVMKTVSVDGLRKLLEGHGQADSVSILLEHFSPAGQYFTTASLRCADAANESAKTYAHIMAAIGKETGDGDTNVDSLATISELSTLRLDLLSPLGHIAAFCD